MPLLLLVILVSLAAARASKFAMGRQMSPDMQQIFNAVSRSDRRRRRLAAR